MVYLNGEILEASPLEPEVKLVCCTIFPGLCPGRPSQPKEK